MSIAALHLSPAGAWDERPARGELQEDGLELEGVSRLPLYWGEDAVEAFLAHNPGAVVRAAGVEPTQDYRPFCQLGDIDLALVAEGVPSLGLEIKVSGSLKSATVQLARNYNVAVSSLSVALEAGFGGLVPVLVGPWRPEMVTGVKGTRAWRLLQEASSAEPVVLGFTCVLDGEGERYLVLADIANDGPELKTLRPFLGGNKVWRPDERLQEKLREAGVTTWPPNPEWLPKGLELWIFAAEGGLTIAVSAKRTLRDTFLGAQSGTEVTGALERFVRIRTTVVPRGSFEKHDSVSQRLYTRFWTPSWPDELVDEDIESLWEIISDIRRCC